MVKGVTRRVIIVRSPDPRLFEEAIFIVKEDVITRDGVDPHELLQEAQNVANGYIKNHVHGPRGIGKVPPWAFGIGGALLSAMVFAVLTFLV